jgi:hypothetical protein
MSDYNIKTDKIDNIIRNVISVTAISMFNK